MRQREAARNGLVAERDKFATTIAWILDPSKTTEKRAAATVGSLCNVVSYYLYGKAIGLVPADMDFSDYYLAEVKAARIRYYAGEDAAGVFWGEGSLTWLQQRNLIRLRIRTSRSGSPARTVIADPIGHPSRRDELRAFLASSADVALSHQDFENTPPRKAHHFLLIVKGPDGIWRNMDHVTDSYRRRGGITDWNRVFRIEADAALIAQAKAKLEPAPAGP